MRDVFSQMRLGALGLLIFAALVAFIAVALSEIDQACHCIAAPTYLSRPDNCQGEAL